MPSTKANPVSENKMLGGSSKRVSQFSYIRTAACIAIVLLHCINSARVYHADAISAGEAAAAFTALSDLMWAVPCFLMVTGALLLDPERSLGPKKLFGKYIRRMVGALVVFTLIFTLIKHEPGPGSSIAREFFDGLLFNHCMAYLWYLYLMIGLYLLMPLFRRIAAAAGEERTGKLTLAAGAAVSLAALVLRCTDCSQAADLVSWLIYPVYLFIGYTLRRRNMDIRLAAVLLIACSIALPLITNKTAGSYEDPSWVFGYSMPLVVLQSAAAYSLMLRIKKEATELVNSIDSCSFGIYLIHMVFLRLAMKELGFNPFDFGPFSFIGLSIIAFLLSYGATFILKKVRFIDFL